jgi:hypothetical protein
MLTRRYLANDPSTNDVTHDFAVLLVSNAWISGDGTTARQLAMDWAQGVARRSALESADTWKFFKRAVVRRWFGPLESRKFMPPWNCDDVLCYAAAFITQDVRLSVFSTHLACHAPSMRLPKDLTALRQVLLGVDRNEPIEVFPESSSTESICFRRFSYQFGEDVLYEAGFGQAMYTFEAEQGDHLIIRASKASGSYQFETAPDLTMRYQTLARRLGALLRTHDTALEDRCFCLCRALGIEYVSIEGYFEQDTDRLTIVDVDLPLDFAFMGHGSSPSTQSRFSANIRK